MPSTTSKLSRLASATGRVALKLAVYLVLALLLVLVLSAVVWTWPVVWRFGLSALAAAGIYRLTSLLRSLSVLRMILALGTGLAVFLLIRGDHPESQGEWIMLGVLAAISLLWYRRRNAPATLLAPPPANRPDAAKEDRSPREFTSDDAARLVDALDRAWGSTRPGVPPDDDDPQQQHAPRPGIRAVHAHGSWATATFTPTTSRGSRGSWLSTADIPLLQRCSIDAVVRFSNFAGAAERDDGARQPHGMAVKLVDGEFAGMDLLGVDMRQFPVRTRDDFFTYMNLFTKGGLRRLAGWLWMALTGRTTVRAVLGTRVSPKSSYVDRTYHGLSTFCCLIRDPDGQAEEVPVRYRMVPTHAQGGPTEPYDRLRLDVDLRQRLDGASPDAPIAFDVEMVDGRGTPQESLGDPVTAWPLDQPAYQLGRLELERYLGDGVGCPIDDMTFNPHRLPTGIRHFDDEILMARRAAYPESHRRRTRARPRRRP